MEKDNDLPDGVAGMSDPGDDNAIGAPAAPAAQPADRAANAPFPASEADVATAENPRVTTRAAGASPQRRTPGTAAVRKRDRDTAAQVEEWRLRQASRAVPSAYRQGDRSAMPGQVLLPDDDVLAAQNAIPEQGRPVRTRPSIPNYTPRQDIWDAELVDAEAGGTPLQAPSEDAVSARAAADARAAAQDAGDALRDTAARAGEAGAALIGNIKDSPAAAKAKDLAASAPGYARAAGKRVAAAFRAQDGTLRKKPIAILAAAVLYVLLACWFGFHYYPNTTIGPVKVGGMDVAQATEALGKAVDGYVLQVTGEDDVSFTVLGSEAGLSLDANDLAHQAMDADSGLLWPLEVLLPHDHTDVMVASASAGGFLEKISDAVAWYNEDATMPVNATIRYSKEDQAFSIVPEKEGNTLSEEKIVEHVKEALASMQPVLELGADDYEQPAVRQDDARLKTALAEAQKVLQTDVTFTAHGKAVSTLNGTTAATWVTTDEDVQLALDEDQVNAWVQNLVETSDTVGAKRTWTREDGVKCTVEGGTYGWEADWLAVDEALHEAIGAGEAQTVEVPMAQEAAVYNGAGKRDWKAYIDVDLGSQHATYYDDKGTVLWEADFVSGKPDGEHDTPMGVYYINYKESPSTLVGEANATGSPEYRTEVQYWMPWRGNDVGFHDADWQDAFGGTRYAEGFGSHGCINLSPDDAQALYELAPVDTVVVCHGADASVTVPLAAANEGAGDADDAADDAGEEDAGE